MVVRVVVSIQIDFAYKNRSCMLLVLLIFLIGSPVVDLAGLLMMVLGFVYFFLSLPWSFPEGWEGWRMSPSRSGEDLSVGGSC